MQAVQKSRICLDKQSRLVATSERENEVVEMAILKKTPSIIDCMPSHIIINIYISMRIQYTQQEKGCVP